MSSTLRRNEARSALIEAALVQLAAVGPTRVHPNELCRDLGLSKALVNYHFGNREGLILEAMALGYERYVDTLMAAADAAGPEALDRLYAWMDAQVDWTVAHPGLAAALNFPTVLGGEPTPESAPLQERIHVAGNRNFATLQRLVADARREAGGADPDAAGVGLDSAVLGWLTLGMSVWIAGRHLPTRELGYVEYLPVARERVRAVVAGLIAD